MNFLGQFYEEWDLGKSQIASCANVTSRAKVKEELSSHSKGSICLDAASHTGQMCLFSNISILQ